MIKRKWKTIKHFKNVVDGIYQVSNDGEVRIKGDKGFIHKKIANKKHHPYYAVNLCKTNGKFEWVLVHQLVATFFVEIPIKYVDLDVELVPDHLDNNGLNNLYTNLEWKTRGENVKIAHEKGHINNRCDNNANAIVTNEQVYSICKFLEDGLTYDEILECMNFPDSKKYRKLLIRIKNKNAWTDISDKYNIETKTCKYTAVQRETIDKIPDILNFIKLGYSNSEIVKFIWGKDLSKSKKEIKRRIVKGIRDKKIYKEILSKFND